MNVDEIMRRYSQLPQRRLYRKVKDQTITPETNPSGYRLTFGKFKGEVLSNVPPDYLEWIITSVTNRPDVVNVVKRYLNVPEEAPSVQKRSSLVQRLKNAGMPKIPVPAQPQPPISAEEGGDLHFMPYPFPNFEHELMDTTYGGIRLTEIRLQDLEQILERYPDPKLQDFINCRCCHLYRFFVHHMYEKALSIDVSKLNGEGLLQYEVMMNVCREIQSTLDSVRDPALARDILQSSRFDSVFTMKLPRSA
jgi:hypothetical protein